MHSWQNQLLPFPRLADGPQVPPSRLFSANFLRLAVRRRTGVQVSVIAVDIRGGGRGGIPSSRGTVNITQKATGSCTDSQLLILTTCVCDLAFAPLIPLTTEKWK
jgi:hypothetical protein